MKSKTTTFTLLLLLSCYSHRTLAQYDCSQATSISELNVNNVKTAIKNGGDLWWDASDGKYVVPQPESGMPEVSAIFAGGLWMGGFDLAGNLKIAASTYGAFNGDVDFFAGPLSEFGITDDEQCSDFDRIWTTSSGDISAHISDWTNNGIIDGPVPASILEWPGNENPEFESIFGFELPEADHGLAPFIDRNFNGIYEPNSGDYPDINGADEGHWSVFNDAGNSHLETGGDAMRMEIQLLAYAYNSNEPAINNATFYDYKFINKRVETLDSTTVGIWVDPDLGCYLDDYIGCSPEDNMAYFYNQDELDGDPGCSCPSGINTYCDEIPVVGIKILRGIAAERVFDEDGNVVPTQIGQQPDTIVEEKMTNFIVMDGIQTPAPTTDIGYFRLLTGTWSDGTPLTYGGNGYNPGSTDYTEFIYPGNPAVDTSWSMCSVGNAAGDYRMLMSVGPFKMEPDQVKTMSFAVIAALDVPHPCPDISVLQQVGDEVCDFYNNNFNVGTNTPVYNNSNLTLSPNPFSIKTQLELDDENEQLQQVELFSVTGQLLRSYNNLSANSLTIEQGNLTTGIFIYKALTKNGKVYSGKFIVN